MTASSHLDHLRSLESQLSTLQQRLAEVEGELAAARKTERFLRYFEVPHDGILERANRLCEVLADHEHESLAEDVHADVTQLLRQNGELTAQRDLAIKERDELKMVMLDLADDICGLQPVTTIDGAIRAISQYDLAMRQERERWQPVIDAAKALRATFASDCVWTNEEAALATAISSALTPAADGQKEK